MNISNLIILRKWRILVIDDDLETRHIIGLLLKRYGADALFAQNGAEGLEAVYCYQPKFIICDLSMPKLDGWGFIRALKHDQLTQHIPVITLTNHQDCYKKAIAEGFHHCLSKPLRPQTFVNELLSALMDIPTIAQEINQLT